MRAILTSPRVLRTGQPLTLEGIRQVCPSVFADGPHSSRGDRYRFVPTETPVRALLDNGWGVYEASQQRARTKDRDGYGKHMLRMRKLTDFDVGPVVGDGVPEVILINAHDGTAAYHLKAGFFRFVCSNGLMVGTQISGFTVRHTVGPQTAQEVLEAGERVVTESFPKMLENIEMFKSMSPGPSAGLRLAVRAMALRFGTLPELWPMTPAKLLDPKREEDMDPTLWNMLNRIQENIIYGGIETTSMGFGRRSMVRPVERVTAVASINAGIWDEAAEIAKEYT